MVVWITGVPSSIPDGGLENPFVLGRWVVLQKYMFDSPKATACERGDFRSDFCWVAKKEA